MRTALYRKRESFPALGLVSSSMETYAPILSEHAILMLVELLAISIMLVKGY